MAKPQIISVKQLVDALGGVYEVKDIIGVSRQAVYQAVKLDRLPGLWHVRLYKVARRKRLKVAPRLFGEELP